MFYCNVNKINQSIFRVNALNSQCRDSSSQDCISPNLNNNQIKHYYIRITFVFTVNAMVSCQSKCTNI